jgi:hypothetical protein
VRCHCPHVPVAVGHSLPAGTWAAILAAVLTIAANWPGIREAWAGEFRPRLASWGPWTGALLVGAGSEAVTRTWAAVAYNGACALGCALILACGWRARERGWDWLDVTCGVLASAGVGLLAVSAADPALLPVWGATVAAVAADLIAYLPTFGDGWSDPHHQPLAMYAMFAAAAGLTVAAVGWSAAAIYPGYLLAADAVMCGLVYLGRSRARPSVDRPRPSELEVEANMARADEHMARGDEHGAAEAAR